MLEKVNSDAWTGTLTSAKQDDRIWDNLIGLQHAVSDGSTDSSSFATYGRVDRTVETELQAIVKNAETEASNGNIDSTSVALELIRKAKFTYDLTKKYAGAGTFAVTTPTLFDKLMDEAEARNLRTVSSGSEIPEVGMEGFKLPLIHYQGTWVTYDPSCPSGEMYILTPRSWILEVKRNGNLRLEGGIHEKWKEEEDGEYYHWGKFHFQPRLICREPHLQFKYINLTT